jgi:hypothetical protein
VAATVAVVRSSNCCVERGKRRVPMRALPVLVVLTLLAALPVAPRAARAEDPEPRISFSVERLPLRQAVEKLAKEAGLTVTVAEAVPDPPITLSVRNAPPHTALRLLLRAGREPLAGYGVFGSGKRYEVRLIPLEEQERDFVPERSTDPRLTRMVSLDFRRTGLRRAVEILVAGSGVRVEVEPKVPEVPVTLSLKDRTAFDGLREVVTAAQRQVPELLFERERGVYLLTMNPRAPADPAALAVLREKKVTLKLQAVPLREAVGRIFFGSGLQFSVHPNVPEVKVTLEVEGATLEEALQRLVRAAAKEAPGLTLGQAGVVFLIETRGPAAVPVPGML